MLVSALRSYHYKNAKCDEYSYTIRFLFEGQHGGLRVAIRSYSPDVQCVPGSEYEDEGACSALSGTLPTQNYPTVFTRKTPRPGQNVLIPQGGKHFSSGMYFGISILNLLRARY